MIGLILCAGRGTRLGDETKDKPKCMVDVCGKPVLERIADSLEKIEFKKIIVNLHCFPKVVMKHFGQRFLYLYEPVPMGEFATTSLVRGWFPKEELMVINGDTLTDLNLFECLMEARRCSVPENIIFTYKNKHMGVKIFTNPNSDAQLYWDKKCWYQDMGTPEGLEKARKHYAGN
jgi:NDP-sugar pyrophosphorylase family protein